MLSCNAAEPLTPRGPLHPRTFLLTVYRADILSVLAAEGLVSDPLTALSEWWVGTGQVAAPWECSITAWMSGWMAGWTRL